MCTMCVVEFSGISLLVGFEERVVECELQL